MTWGEQFVAYATMYVFGFGFSVIPAGRDKKPLVAWEEFQSRRPKLSEILSWPRENLAIVTGAISGVIVVDCDSDEDAAWFQAEMSDTNAIVKTRRGKHLYFVHPGGTIRNGQKIAGRYDVRGDGGYVLAPPSRHDEGWYFWERKIERVDTLPEFNVEWRPEVRAARSYDRVIHDGVAYIEKIRAVSGSGGHNDTFRAACVLRDSGMPELDAFLALRAWNETNAEPPWTEKELRHKIVEAYRKEN